MLPAVSRQLSTSRSSDLSPGLSRDDLDRLFATEDFVAAPCAASTGQKLCVLGIDPDISGAVAVLQWELFSDSTQLQLQDAKIELHDMPVVSVAIGKRFQRCRTIAATSPVL